MELADILSEGSVLFCTDIKTKRDVLERLSSQAAVVTGFPANDIFEALSDREALGSTGLGHGVAIPHGRIKGLKNPLAAVLRVKDPIAFDAPDDEPVSLLIFLLVPEAATQRHLEILSEIAEMLSDRELRERLKSEAAAIEVHRMIAAWEPLKSVA